MLDILIIGLIVSLVLGYLRFGRAKSAENVSEKSKSKHRKNEMIKMPDTITWSTISPHTYYFLVLSRGWRDGETWDLKFNSSYCFNPCCDHSEECRERKRRKMRNLWLILRLLASWCKRLFILNTSFYPSASSIVPHNNANAWSVRVYEPSEEENVRQSSVIFFSSLSAFDCSAAENLSLIIIIDEECEES